MQINSIDNNIENRRKKWLKPAVVASSATGVGLALACIAKKQGFSLSPSAIKRTPMKDWAIFTIYDKNLPNRKEIELGGKEVIQLASASVAGGLAGGALVDDKKHLKAKLKESVNQLLGNVIVPITCVWAASSLYKNNKAGILKYVPQIKETGNFSKYFNKGLKAVPGSIITLASLGAGIIAGNKVSNILNEKIFHKKIDRHIKGTDFAPHVDDIGVAVSLMAEKSPFASLIQRSVPLFLCVPGIETGMHKED